MKQKTNKLVFLAIAILGITGSAQAQTSYKQTADSYVTIAGTSTLHNWTMTSKEMVFQATFERATDGTLLQASGVTLTLPARSLKSAHNAMDQNTYSALKADKFKNIAFTLTSAKVIKNLIQCSGSLAISGVTKPVSVDANCQPKADGTLNCTGNKTIKMSDFQVEPPTFMFGTVKTGDEITISFNLTLTQVKN